LSVNPCLYPIHMGSDGLSSGMSHTSTRGICAGPQQLAFSLLVSRDRTELGEILYC
jgi:hypothetical protein